MFSSSPATATEALRPGLIAGCYPERNDRVPGRMESACMALRGYLAQVRSGRRSGLRKVSAAIGRAGEALADLDGAQLDKLRIDLRRRFRLEGLSEPLCIRAFALIRELAARTIQLRHYDSQLMGGWVMLHGQLAEMETGEGKTLAATLAAATAALAQIPVHVITVNEYLVQRDARAMAPLYQALGLTVGYVTQSMQPADRRSGYACDITYCTNKQVAFDYLHDRLLLGNNRSQMRLQLESAYGDDSRLAKFLLRGLCFAIVDEADSVLIDEAITPLILTRNVDSAVEHAAYCRALKLARKLIGEADYYLDPVGHDVQLSRSGQQRLARHPLSRKGLWRNARRREELVCQALRALHLLHRDRDYLVSENKVLIIDANTGRTMPDRSWERGLHQMVEAKEGCPLTGAREQLGRLTYQRFFSRYLRLGGMTGTASEVRTELGSDYGLRVQRIPLHRPSRRRELPALIYPRAKEKWAAVVAAVAAIHARGRPVLIGTASVEDSELLSRKLTAAGIAHRVLNARQDRAEADIVAAAGQPGSVTVATNMAGRGTDIPLAAGVAELGGLHVIAACRNNARRIDRQLSGRCARQGDPGSHQSIISLEDHIVRQNGWLTLTRILSSRRSSDGWLQRKLALYLVRRAQRAIERRHRVARLALRQFDRVTSRLLAFSGQLE